MSEQEQKTHDTGDSDGRRAFLKECARYAAVTAPAMMLLLSPDKGLAGSPGEHHKRKRRKRRKGRDRRKWRKWRRARRDSD